MSNHVLPSTTTMKKNSPPILCLISCLFIFCVLVSTYALPTQLLFSSTLLSKINVNDQIIGVKTFLTLFVIKRKGSKLVDYVKEQANHGNHDVNRQLVMEWLKTNPISIGVQSTHVNYLTGVFKYFNVSIQDGSLSSSAMSSSSNTFFKIYPSFDACQKRNYLDRYDAVLLEPYTFSFFVRWYRDAVSSTSSIPMESFNFIPLPLIPYEVYSNRTLESSSASVMSELFNIDETVTCDHQPDVSDAQFIRLLNGYSNFSQQDVSIIERITLKSPLHANWTIVNSKLPSILSSSPFTRLGSSTFNASSLDNVLLSSSCYMCQTSTCAGENFNPLLDYWIIPQFVIIFGYFVLLFGFGLFKKPSMRRRIALPYCPILILTLMIMFTNLSRICVCVFYNISTFVVIWWVFMYSVTIVRFYYLRNLYSLITRFPKREKFMKIMASEKNGFIISVLMTFVLALVFNLQGIFLFFNEPKPTADVFRPAVFISFVLLGALLGLVVVIWDMITNSKRIGKYGLIHYLFFDDPLYVRLDMLSLGLLMIVAVLVVVGQATLNDSLQGLSSTIGGLFNTIFCIALLLITGGNTVIIELYKKARYARTPKKDKDDLEIVLQNEDLLNLLKEYSAKEFSSENIEMYSTLMKLKEKKVVLVQDFEEIDDTFIKNYSKYEVNFPSSCKREFYKLKEQALEKSQIDYQVLWEVVGSDLVLNLLDTFKRLQETSSYRQWESVLKYQKHVHP